MYTKFVYDRKRNYSLFFKFIKPFLILMLLSVLCVCQPSPPSTTDAVSTSASLTRMKSETHTLRIPFLPTATKLNSKQLKTIKEISSSKDEIKINLNQLDLEKWMKELLYNWKIFEEAKETVYQQLSIVTEYLILTKTALEISRGTSGFFKKTTKSKEQSLTTEAVLSDPEFTFFTQFFEKNSWVSEVLIKTRKGMKQDSSGSFSKQHHIQKALDYWVLKTSGDILPENTILSDGIYRIPFQPFFNALQFQQGENLYFKLELRLEECLEPMYRLDMDKENGMTLKRVFEKVFILLHEYQTFKLYSFYYEKLYTKFLDEVVKSRCRTKKHPYNCEKKLTPTYTKQEFFFPFSFELNHKFSHSKAVHSYFYSSHFSFLREPFSLKKTNLLPPENKIQLFDETSKGTEGVEKVHDSGTPFSFDFDETELDQYPSFVALPMVEKKTIADSLKKHHFKFSTFALSFIMDFVTKDLGCVGNIQYGSHALKFSYKKGPELSFCYIKHFSFERFSNSIFIDLLTDYLHRRKLEQIINHLLQDRLKVAYWKGADMKEIMGILEKYAGPTEFSKKFLDT